MSHDPIRRQPPPARPRFRRARATLLLLGISWVVYFLLLLLPDSTAIPLRNAMALSTQGLQRGYFWEVATFLFVHLHFWHLLANSILLYFAGRALERAVGLRRLLITFFVGGWLGGAAEYIYAMAHAPTTLIMGNSAGACAVLLAIATLHPKREAVLLLFVIPIRIQAIVFGLTILIGSLLLAFLDQSSAVGHWGHFIGALTGLFLGFLMRQTNRPPLPDQPPPPTNQPPLS